METILAILGALVMVSGGAGLKIDREYERGVIFRLGRVLKVGKMLENARLTYLASIHDSSSFSTR